MKSEKKNFYFNTNGDQKGKVEVYVGQSSGKQLNEDILKAKKEVLIVSPYIDESKLDDLIALKERGVNVRLAFSDLRDNQKYKVLRKLIHQQRDVNINKKKQIEKRVSLFSVLSTISLSAGIILMVYTALTFRIDLPNLIQLIGGLFLITIFYFLLKYKRELQKTPIYRYEYSEKLNFKYLRNNYKSNDKMFIHSKIYVIDGKVAYLGSMNYTNNGFTSNFETRVRITNTEKISELVDFVHGIFENEKNFSSHELWFLGRGVYSEELY